MKRLSTILFAGMLMLTTVALASFPVQKSNKQEKQEYVIQNNGEEAAVGATGIQPAEELVNAPENVAHDAQNGQQIEEKWILVLLLVFLGGVAAHRWYARKPIGWNILFILTAGGCGIWLLVDLIHILTDQF